MIYYRVLFRLLSWNCNINQYNYFWKLSKNPWCIIFWSIDWSDIVKNPFPWRAVILGLFSTLTVFYPEGIFYHVISAMTRDLGLYDLIQGTTPFCVKPGSPRTSCNADITYFMGDSNLIILKLWQEVSWFDEMHVSYLG